MLRKDAKTANNENVGQSLITSRHLFFNRSRVVIVRSSYQKNILTELEDENLDLKVAKKLFNQIAAIEFNSPHWRDAAIRLRTQVEGKELALLEVIKKHGRDLISKFMRKIAMGDPKGAHSLLEESMLRKLCLIFHPDKWHSPHSDAVFTALKEWAMSAKDLLEQASEQVDLRADNKDVHEKLLREMKEYIKRTHQHLRESGELLSEVLSSTIQVN